MVQQSLGRIYGIETEYGLTCLAPDSGKRILSAEAAARILFKPQTEAVGATNAFLKNGSRLYLDVGAHPEYATAECDNLLDLLNQDRAGEQLLLQLARQADQELQRQGRPGRIVLFKNNVDSYGNSYGCYENYLIKRIPDYPDFADALLGFFTTRQLICGAGKVVRDKNHTRFVLSQRADQMLDAVSAATTRSRPMINTRDEPHANLHRYRRMHVIVGDSNLSDVTTLLKVGTTELVLRVLESDPHAFDKWLLEDPIAAIKSASQDMQGRSLIKLQTGSTISALELQGRFWERCAGLNDLPSQLIYVLKMWEKVLDSLDQDRLNNLDTEIDWVIKYQWLNRYAQSHNVSLDSVQIAQLDLAFHQITSGGIFRLLEAKGQVKRITSADSIAKATVAAPATRALLRAQFLQTAQQHGLPVEVDWAKLKVPHMEAGELDLSDPFATQNWDLSKLLQRMATFSPPILEVNDEGPIPI